MRKIQHQTTVGMVLSLTLFGLNVGVHADPLLNCRVSKIDAAAERAKCLAKEEENKLKGKAVNVDACEDQFDAAITLADTVAAVQGAACRYIANGDGTVSDLNTLLIWEMKILGASTSFDSRGVGNCLHCVDDFYAWNMEVYEWLAALNGRTDSASAQSGFAGHEDWRIPNVLELQTILLQPFPCETSPCIDPIFGPTLAANYWSSTALATELTDAWGVSFSNGSLSAGGKGLGRRVRGVRGGR